MPQVALVGPELEENLSLRYLASSLTAAGIGSDIVPFDAGTDVPAVLAHILERGNPPALVGLSLAFQPRARDFLALAVALRQHGFRGHLTAGGHFATFAYRDILRDFPEVDTILRFEAEHTLPALAAAVIAGDDPGTVPGLVSRRADSLRVNPPSPSPDLATLPWPDRRGAPAEHLGHPVAAMVGSRGCYARCAFCCIAAWHAGGPGPRHRLRPADDVADEMSWLRREKGVHLFVFHDDNFFLPRRDATLARIAALGDALDRRGVGDFAVIVKARPNDLDDEVVAAMRARLGLIRLFLGVESATTRGLRTLGRGLAGNDNARALDLLRRTGVYTCFNMLVFDPESTIDDLDVNLRFMERYGDVPHNFGRVELYAGTPLLERLQARSCCTGDYLGWDYPLADDDIQRVFEMAMACFYTRNFSELSTPHRLMGTRFLVEVSRRFHPDVFDARWLSDARALTRRLTLDSVAAVREIIGFVRDQRTAASDRDIVPVLSARLRTIDADIHEAADELEATIARAVAGDDVGWHACAYTGGCHVQNHTHGDPGT